MRLHGWTRWQVNVYLDPTGHFEAIVSKSDDEDAYRGTGDRPMDAIFDAFRSIGKD